MNWENFVTNQIEFANWKTEHDSIVPPTDLKYFTNTFSNTLENSHRDLGVLFEIILNILENKGNYLKEQYYIVT